MKIKTFKKELKQEFSQEFCTIPDVLPKIKKIAYEKEFNNLNQKRNILPKRIYQAVSFAFAFICVLICGIATMEKYDVNDTNGRPNPSGTIEEFISENYIYEHYLASFQAIESIEPANAQSNNLKISKDILSLEEFFYLYQYINENQNSDIASINKVMVDEFPSLKDEIGLIKDAYIYIINSK